MAVLNKQGVTSRAACWSTCSNGTEVDGSLCRLVLMLYSLSHKWEQIQIMQNHCCLSNLFVPQVCADTLIGSDQVRGVSGGQRKRVTTGQVLLQLLHVCMTGNHSSQLAPTVSTHAADRLLEANAAFVLHHDLSCPALYSQHANLRRPSGLFQIVASPAMSTQEVEHIYLLKGSLTYGLLCLR